MDVSRDPDSECDEEIDRSPAATRYRQNMYIFICACPKIYMYVCIHINVHKYIYICL